MTYMLFMIPVVAGGIAFALPLTTSRPAPSIRQAAVDVESTSTSCHGAAEYPLQVEVTPTQIFSFAGASGESVELGLDVVHNLGDGARVIHAVEVLDDRGNTVVPRKSSRIEVLSRDSKTSYTLRLPPLSKDGFFVARVSVAGKDAAGATDERVVETYWQVSSGRLFQHEYADWLKISNAGKAVKL
jgi:hypothetical protein